MTYLGRVVTVSIADEPNTPAAHAALVCTLARGLGNNVTPCRFAAE
jgi:hypothetical protein